MYYSKIGNPGAGFTNQIIALITSIINAYKKGCKIVIVDNFLNDINKETFTPISEIFNLNQINVFLKNYDIVLVDKDNIQFELLSAIYGADNTIDLTNELRGSKLVVNYPYNNIKGDPCPGIVKKLVIKYKIGEHYFEESYNENAFINIHFDGPYLFTFGWINSFNDNMFDKILKNIVYNDTFILKSQINITGKINVIHLRLENDGIVHWSKQNNITPNEYKEILEQKYIQLIEKYISKTDENIIMSSETNKVIDFLHENNYKYRFGEKGEDREKNAIVDLLISKYCNNIFIGNFNIKKSNGSTFSYYMGKCMNNVSKIYIDLDRIHDNEVIYKI